MPIIPIIGAGIAARTVGGIIGKGARLVNPINRNMTDKIQSNSVKPVTSKKTPSIEESKAKIKKDLNIPEKGTPEYERYLAAKESKARIALMTSRIKPRPKGSK